MGCRAAWRWERRRIKCDHKRKREQEGCITTWGVREGGEGEWKRERRGVTGGQRGSSEGQERGRSTDGGPPERVQRPSISRGTVYRVGRTGVREETGTAGEQRGRKETGKPTKMETPSRAGG